MASLSQVLSTLTGHVTTAIYPDGTSSPSVANVDTTIISAFPIRNEIDAILNMDKALVAVIPTTKNKIVTKFERVFQDVEISEATITAVVNGATITIGGTVSIPQSVVAIVNSSTYSYKVLEDDTLEDIAANLTLLIPGATCLGTVITLDNPYRVTVRIATGGVAALELSRQERIFSICCWTTSLDVRDALLASVDEYLKLNFRLILPDNFYCMVWPMETAQPLQDSLQKQRMIIGNAEYKIQYATTYTRPFTTIADTIQNVTIEPSL